MDLLEGGDALESRVETDEGGGLNHSRLCQSLPTGWDEVLQLLEEISTQTLQYRLSASIPVSLFTATGAALGKEPAENDRLWGKRELDSEQSAWAGRASSLNPER